MASIKVGAAWWKQDRNGQDYLSVSFDPACPVVINPGQRAALFPNPNKVQPNQPDFELVILPTRQADMEGDDFSPEQQPRNSYAQSPQRQTAPGAPASYQAPPPEAYEAPSAPRAMAPRSATPAPRQPAPAPQRPVARPTGQRRPALPPDYEPDLSDLEDPFAE